MKTTLYFESPGFALRKSDDVFKILKDGRLFKELPAFQIESVIVSCEGFSISGGAIELCISHNIPVFYLQRDTSKMGVLTTAESQWPERQAAQIGARDDFCKVFSLSRGFLTGKIKNQLYLVKYMCHSRRLKSTEFKRQIKIYGETVLKSLAGLDGCADPDIRLMRDRLFGCEGRAAAQYWKMFAVFVPNSMKFPGRKGRGADDPVNCLLNYGYAVLSRKIQYAIIQEGLSAYFSFLHTPQRGRSNLVCDLIEEFRPWAVDKVVLSMIARYPRVSIDKTGKLKSGDRRRLITKLEEKWFKDKLHEQIKTQVGALRSVLEKGGVYKPIIWNSNNRKGRKMKKC